MNDRTPSLPRIARSLLLLLSLVTAAAQEGAPQADPAQEGPQIASLRFLHLSPDAPLVDVVVEGRLHLRDLGLRDRSRFASLPAGRHEIQVYPHRLPSAAEGPVLAPQERPAPADGASEAAAGDGDGAQAAAEDAPPQRSPEAPVPRTLEPITAIVELEPGSYTTLVLTGYFELPTREEGRGNLSVDVEPPEASLSVTGPQGYSVQRTGDQLLQDLEPGTYEAVVVREGYQRAVYEVDVEPGGTTVVTVTLQEADAEGEPEPLLQQEDAQGAWRTLELQPYGADLPLPAPGRALVRFVHAAPTVPHLSIRTISEPAGDEGAAGEDPSGAAATPDGDRAPPLLQVDRLAYPNATDYLEISAGARGIEFRIAGTDSVVYTLSNLRLRPGFTYTLFVAAGPANGEIWIVPSVDAAIPQRPPASGGP